MKHCLIGDLHVQDGNIAETDIIVDFIVDYISKRPEKMSITFLGDTTHTHNIVKQTVTDCIKRGMIKVTSISQLLGAYYVTGNHDNQDPKGGPINSADLIMSGLNIKVSGFTNYHQITGSDLYIVGFRHQNMFVDTCKEIYAKNPNSIILHHQTIDGSKYESGMPAIGGIQPADLPNKLFIGGHVHTKQSFGKFIYVGSPRALSFSDVNEDKGFHIFDDETLQFEFISLNGLTKCFYSTDYYQDQMGDNLAIVPNPSWKSGDDIKIHIHGSSDFYKKMFEANKKLQTLNIGKISFIPHVKKTLESKVDSKQVETDIFKAFEGYVFNVYNADKDMKGKIWHRMETLSKQVKG